jgi:hypothetical protein
LHSQWAWAAQHQAVCQEQTQVCLQNQAVTWAQKNQLVMNLQQQTQQQVAQKN